MRIFRYAAVTASALALLLVGVPAHATSLSVFGTGYSVLVDNIGGAGDPFGGGPITVPLVFDGTQKAIAGTSLVVQERIVALPAGTGFAFDPSNPELATAPVSLMDIWIKDTGVAGIPAPNGSFSDLGQIPQNFLPSAVVVQNLTFPGTPAGFKQISVANSAYVWFSNDDVEVGMTPLDPNIAAGLMPHPFGGGCPAGLGCTPTGLPVNQVLFTGNTSANPFDQIGVATSVFGAGVTWAQVELGLGLNGLSVNDLHVSVLVAEVPEPSTLVLLGLGLAAVAGGLRRRSS